MNNLELFRYWIDVCNKYGSEFKNIEVSEKDNTFVITAVNPEEDIIIRVPFPILLPLNQIEITNEIHRVKLDYKIENDVREMLNSYLDFILSDERVNSLKRLLDSFSSLPEEFQESIIGLVDKSIFKKLDRKDIKKKLLQARVLNMQDKGTVLMPIIDFLNHDDNYGIGYNIKDNQVEVKGKASPNGEVFAHYNGMIDPFGYLNTFFFIPNASNAISVQLDLSLDDDKTLKIARNVQNVTINKDGILEQKYCVSPEQIIISMAWIGSLKRPLNPFMSFKKLWEEELHRKDAIKYFSIIKSLNIMKMLEILKMCDKYENFEVSKLIREATIKQLELIAQSYETGINSKQ